MGLAHQHVWLTDFARQDDPDELIIPDDLTTVSDEDLDTLHDQALAAFDAIYGADGSEVDSEGLDQLQQITDGITLIRDEQNRRAEEKAARTEKAAELAGKIKPADDTADEAAAAEDCEDCDNDTDAADAADGDADRPAEVTAETDGEVDTSNVPDDASEITESQPEPVAASARPKRRGNSTRINLSGIRASQARTPKVSTTPTSMADIVTAAPDMPGYANGQGMEWIDIGRGIDRRLGNFQESQYRRAQREGKHLRQQFGVASFRKPFAPDLVVTNREDGAHLDTVMDRAVDESRLPGGSLVASGGWCAPSETVYELCQMESRDGMLTIPEIQVSRGGIRYATGPDFASLYNDTGFCYTEQDDIDGDYDGNGGGSKPCADVPCPDWTDYRLNLCGTCVTSGLLQSRAYPEALARFTSGVMIAHEHRVNAAVINAIVAGSTAVDWPSPQAGATAPLLSAVEFEVELIKQAERMARGTSMEAVFPYWARGLIRADLSRRLGVDLLDVPDARIVSWFAQRGVSVQFVYDWQDLDTTSVAYPDSIDFLVYPAGAWVKGTEDIISLDTVYDSTQLGENNFTALFFEEGYLVAPRCGESRAVTVPVCPSGSTNAGELIGCDGTSSGSAS